MIDLEGLAIEVFTEKFQNLFQHRRFKCGGGDTVFAADGQQIGQTAFGTDFAAVKNDDTVTDIFDITQQMTGDDNGFAAFFESEDQIFDLTAAQRVKPGSGFVKDQQFGVIDHSLGQTDTALHTFGKLADPTVAGMSHADHIEQLFNAFLTILFGKVEERTEEIQRFFCGQILVEIRVFRQITDLFFGFHRTGGFAEHGQFAAGGIKQSQQHFHGRGFTGPVGPQKTDDLTLTDLKINIIDRFGLGASPEIPEHLGQAYGLYDRLMLFCHFYLFSCKLPKRGSFNILLRHRLRR